MGPPRFRCATLIG
ncbi:hypothetical protein LINPERPRIM_LOCUS12302 [Linum perenne]